MQQNGELAPMKTWICFRLDQRQVAVEQHMNYCNDLFVKKPASLPVIVASPLGKAEKARTRSQQRQGVHKLLVRLPTSYAGLLSKVSFRSQTHGTNA